ncbi:hypothetical protein BH09PLA1_BH09PLA1_33830 [soil metagenome]
MFPSDVACPVARLTLNNRCSGLPTFIDAYAIPLGEMSKPTLVVSGNCPLPPTNVVLPVFGLSGVPLMLPTVTNSSKFQV